MAGGSDNFAGAASEEVTIPIAGWVFQLLVYN